MFRIHRSDLAWPAHRIAREYASVRWRGPDRIEHDELRLQKLEAAGWRVDNLYRDQVATGAVQWLDDLAAQLRSA